MKPLLEVLEDRTLLSGSPLNPQQITFTASPAASQVAIIAADVFSIVEQKVQQIATIVQYASNAWNTLSWEMVQEVASLQQQVGRIFGINPNTQNQLIATAPPPSSSASGAGQSHASGSGSGSGTMTTAHDAPHPRLENALPLTVSGDGSGSGSASASGSSSFNASVTGQVWLDNNGDGSLDENEMGYSGATVNLLYQVSGSGGSTWATLGSTTTNSNPEGNNYSIGAVVPPGSSYTCEIEVVFPPYFTATYPSAQSVIDAEGFSPVFSLSAGDMAVKPAGMRTMNVNTLTDDPNGPIQQNIVTLRDAIQTGNNGPPFAAVTFNGTPAGTIFLQKGLDPIKKSYDIKGPGAANFTVDGSYNAGTIFTIKHVNTTISGLTINSGSGTNGGGVFNSNGGVTLSEDVVSYNRASDGGGVFNSGVAATLQLQDVVISNNDATSAGGGIENNKGNVDMLGGVVITNNDAATVGGGIYNFSGVVEASPDNQINLNWSDRGGGVANSGQFNMTGGLISDNGSRRDNGGGVRNSGGVMTLVSVRVQGNQAQFQQGGGIYVASGTVTLTSVTISPDANGFKNFASRGGGIYAFGGTVKMLGGAIDSNTATTTGVIAPALAGGGGLYVMGGSVTLTDVGVNFNGSRFNGGGIFVNSGRLNLNKDFVGHNTTRLIGGNGGGMFIAGGTVVVTGGTIEDNSAPFGGGYGGGLFNYAGDLTLGDGLHIFFNTAKSGGGGMFISNNKNATTLINGVEVTSNQSPTGPGIFEQKDAFVTISPDGLTDNDDPGGSPYISGIA